MLNINFNEQQLNNKNTVLLTDLVALKIKERKESFKEVWITLAYFATIAREFKMYVKSSWRGGTIAAE